MLTKLEEIERSFLDLERELSDPEVYNNQERYKKATIAHAELGEVVRVFKEYKQISADLDDNREMAGDSDH